MLKMRPNDVFCFFQFFSVDGSPTLRVLNEMYKHKIGKQVKMSPLDVVTLNLMFSCYGKSISHDPQQ